MAGICSIHKKPDPHCSLCKAHPRDIFPDWDAKLKEAEAAGTMRCAVCGFEFFRTINMCPKCAAMAEPVVLMEVKSCQLELATEMMWFVNEWCRESGWIAPRVKNQTDLAFTIYAYPPNSHGKPDDDPR
jgi:hypothetical protein